MRKITVSDYTLLSLATEGKTSLLFREKLAVALSLDKAGVDVIELPPVKNPKEDSVIFRTIASGVKNARVAVPAGSTKKSLETAAATIRNAAKPMLIISLPVSTVGMEYSYRLKGPAMVEKIRELVEAGRSVVEEVEFEAEDASRAELPFLLEAIRAAEDAGATSICVSDTSGEMMDDEFSAFVKELKKEVRVPLRVKVSDNLSLSVANALSAIRSGADGVKTSVASGSALSLDKLAYALSAKGEKLGVRSSLRFTEIHRDVESILRNIGKEEEKEEETLSGPAIFLDSSSSSEDVAKAVRELGYDLTGEDEVKVYDAVRRLTEKKSSIGSKELEAVVASSAMQVPATYVLKSYVSTISNMVNAVSNVTLERDGESLVGLATGDGPVDSAFKAIEMCVGHHYELDDFQIQAVTEGKEALGSALVRLRSSGRLYSGNGVSTDICGASIRAYISALNKIVHEEGRGV